MADGAVILGVTAVLTSGVFGPLVLHHTQKDRDTLGDRRAMLDAAVDALLLARAQEASLEDTIVNQNPSPDDAEVERRIDDLLHQTQVMEGIALKLQLRFGSGELTSAYTLAAGSINEQGSALSEAFRRRPALGRALERIERAERHFLSAYDRFIEAGAKWHEDASAPFGPR